MHLHRLSLAFLILRLIKCFFYSKISIQKYHFQFPSHRTGPPLQEHYLLQGLSSAYLILKLIKCLFSTSADKVQLILFLKLIKGFFLSTFAGTPPSWILHVKFVIWSYFEIKCFFILRFSYKSFIIKFTCILM